MTRTRLTVAAAGLLLTLTACSGGTGGGDEDKASDAIADLIMKSQEQQTGAADAIFSMKREEADCIGDGFVDRIGVDQLQEYGLLTEDLTTAKNLTGVEMAKEDAEAAADTLMECADVQQMLTKAMGQVDPKTRECFQDVLTDDALRTLFTKMFSGRQDEAGQDLIEPMMECAAPDVP